MPPERPTSVLVIAILNMVLGGLGSLLILCGLASMAINPYVQQMAAKGNSGMPMQPQPPPELVAFQAVGMVVSLILTGGALATGIGLLKMRPWARRWAIALSVLAIALVVAGPILNATVLAEPNRRYTESMEEWSRQLMRGRSVDLKPFVLIGQVVTYGIGALELAYAVTVLVILLRPKTAATFAAGHRTAGKADEF
jgi:hypothetical protein